MRFIIGFLVTIGLIILIIVLLLRGGGTATPTPKALTLADHATGSSYAEFFIDAPVVSQQKHREVKITVSQNEVAFTQYQGYEDSIVSSQTYPNNSEAYEVFLRALQHQNFTVGSTDKALSDERGYCPQGSRYIYSFNDGSKQLMRFWSTSCGGQGTFKGLPTSVRNLFQAQVPDYNRLSRGLYN